MHLPDGGGASSFWRCAMANAQVSHQKLEEMGQLLLTFFFSEDPQPNSDPAWSDVDIDTLRESILKDALGCIIGVGGRRLEAIRRDAWQWITSRNLHPFAFDVCAKSLGADPDELRVAFARLVERSEYAAVQDLNRARALLAEYLEEPGKPCGKLAALLNA